MSLMHKTILAGDIGGTKTLLATARIEDNLIHWGHKERYESDHYASLATIIEEFISQKGLNLEGMTAAFGIAGPVSDQRVKTTNLPWLVDARSLKESLRFDEVLLINDFKAIGLGIPYLEDEDIFVLNEGKKDPEGPVVIIGAGTGLGQGLSLFCPSERRYKVLASEGGHADFAPVNEEEIGLLRYLMEKYDHVSAEKVLSGQGLVNIYHYLAHSGFAERSFETTKKMEEGNPAAVISSLGLAKRDKLCEKAVDMFVSIFGSEAGNLAMKILPTGGLYVGGGMAPKLLKKMTDGTFMKAFLKKGRLSSFMENIPVKIILNEEAGLKGAAAAGQELINR